MATDKLQIGLQLPKFNLLGIDDKYYSQDEFANTPILIIVFGCNHCPYVQANEQRLVEIQNDYKDSVRIVEINSNDATGYPEDSFAHMKIRAAQQGFNFPYLRDETQQIAKDFGATHTPEIFVFDKNRKLVYHGKIDDNWQYPEQVKTSYLRDAIDETLNEIAISVPETYSIGCTIKWK